MDLADCRWEFLLVKVPIRKKKVNMKIAKFMNRKIMHLDQTKV